MYTQTSHKLYVYIDQITYTPSSLGQEWKQIFRLRNCKQWSAAKIWKKRRFDCLCQILPNQHFTSYLTSLHTNQLFLDFFICQSASGDFYWAKPWHNTWLPFSRAESWNPWVCMWVVHLGIIQNSNIYKFNTRGMFYMDKQIWEGWFSHYWHCLFIPCNWESQ